MIEYDNDLGILFKKVGRRHTDVEATLNKFEIRYEVEHSSPFSVYGKVGYILNQYNIQPDDIRRVVFTVPGSYHETNIYIVYCEAERLKKILNLQAFW